MKRLIILATLLAAASVGAQGAPQSDIVVKPPLPAFACPDGSVAEIEEDRAAGLIKVLRGGETLILLQQVGRTPPRFVTGELTVDLEAEHVTLRRPREKPFVCHRLPAEPVAGTVWGTLTKLDRMALVPGSRAKVLIVDVSRADAPSIEIASSTLVTTGNQVPLTFLLHYDSSRILPGLSYALQARFESPKGELTHITDTRISLFAEGAIQAPLEAVLVPVRRAAE